jgi:DNA-damage-inducible protein J
MNKVVIQLKIDKKEEDRAHEVLADIGMDLTTAVGIFLKTVARERRIPFILALDPDNRYI